MQTRMRQLIGRRAMSIRARQHVEMGLLVLVASASAFALYGACVILYTMYWCVASRAFVDSRLMNHAACLYASGLYDRRGAAALLGAKEVPVARSSPQQAGGSPTGPTTGHKPPGSG
jgi:hypothetical protein